MTKNLTSSQLKELIHSYGDDVLFIIPTKPVHFSALRHEKFALKSDERIRTAFVHVDTELYKLSDNHKIHLKPLDPRFETYTFYLMDLAKAVRDGEFQMYVRYQGQGTSNADHKHEGSEDLYRAN